MTAAAIWVAMIGVLLPFSATAFEAGDVLIRGKIAVVHPLEEAKITPTGGELHVNTIVTPAIDATYFLDDEFAVEFIPGLLRHHAKVTGSTRGDKDLGAIWAIAPAVTLQYHHQTESGIKPYLGMGMTYVTYLEDTDVDIEYEGSVGGVLQLGLDMPLDEEKRWWANAEIKKVWVGTQSTQNGNLVKGDIILNPLVMSTGVGYRF